MRKASAICTIAAGVLWAVALFALLMTLLGTHFVPVGYTYVSIFQVAGNGWILPAWGASLVVVLVSAVLCRVLKKKEALNWLSLLLSLAGAAVALVVALEIKGALPEKVGVQYASQGISAWRLIWRHLTPVFAGVLVAVAARLNHVASRDERILAENEAYREHYDLSGDPLFADKEVSTIGLDTYAEDFGVKKPARKLKRSLRRKKKS